MSLSIMVACKAGRTPAQPSPTRAALVCVLLACAGCLLPLWGPGRCALHLLRLFDRLLLALNALEKLVERVGEFLHALVQQLLRDLSIVDARLLQLVQICLPPSRILLNSARDNAVIAEVFDRFQRDR